MKNLLLFAALLAATACTVPDEPVDYTGAEGSQGEPGIQGETGVATLFRSSYDIVWPVFTWQNVIDWTMVNHNVDLNNIDASHADLYWWWYTRAASCGAHYDLSGNLIDSYPKQSCCLQGFTAVGRVPAGSYSGAKCLEDIGTNRVTVYTHTSDLPSYGQNCSVQPSTVGTQKECCPSGFTQVGFLSQSTQVCLEDL